MSPDQFSSGYDHLLHELQRVGQLVALRARAHVALAPEKALKLVGAYLDADDVHRILRSVDDPDVEHVAGRTAPDEIKEAISRVEAFAKLVGARRKASRAAGLVSSFDRLTDVFQLSQTDQDVVLICMLAETNPNVGQLFGYLNDDLTRCHPTVHAIAGTLAPTHADALRFLQLFEPHAKIVAQGLITVDPSPLRPGLGAVRLSSSVRTSLLEHNGLPRSLAVVGELCTPSVPLEQLGLGDQELRRMRSLLRRYVAAQTREREAGRPGTALILSLQGLGPSDHYWIATGLAHSLAKPLLAVDANDMVGGDDPLAVIKEALLFARIRECVLFIRQAASLGNTKGANPSRLREVLRRAGGLVVLDGFPSESDSPRPLPLVRVPLAERGFDARLRLWRRITEQLPLAPDANLPVLASTFRLDASQIQAASAAAHASALWRSGDDEVRVAHADLQAGCRERCDAELAKTARRVKLCHGWDDLVLPSGVIKQLSEMTLRIKHRFSVYDKWGLASKLASSSGVSALFSGASGTGKTMAAGVIAHEIGQDLYRVDLSALVSKYIGETEKNLSKVFAAAERSNAVLFFDEADAVFGKRSEVRDSHDRYANIEIAFLLQQMEIYQGIAILATNLRGNIDQAFTRRLDFIVTFPVPEAHERLRIWQRHLSGKLPLGDIDFTALAEQWELTGGSIRNAVIHAAFAAAEERGDIEQGHLVAAIQREYEKMGRLPTDSRSYLPVE